MAASASSRAAWRARRGCLCLLCWFCLLPSMLQAQTHGVAVRPVDQLLLKAEPRQIATVAFEVSNNTGRTRQFEASPILPQGWRAISAEYPFELRTGETVARFVSFFIPEGTRAGEYELGYVVGDRTEPAIGDAYTIAVQVQARPGLQVGTLEAPDAVLSGEDFTVVFVIQNRGNIPISADFTVSSSRGAPLEPRAGTASLEPGKSQPLAVRVKVEELRENGQDWITLTVRSTDGALADSATVTVRLLPRVSGVEQRFHMLPSTLGLRGAFREKAGTRRFAWQAELGGAGTLDEAGEQRVAFLLRGPGLANETILGSLDEYRFDYQGTRLGLSLGDRVYALSPLSEAARYGRGARADYQHERWQFETYHMRDRFSAEPGQQTAVSAGYRRHDGTQLNVNYLQKEGKLAADILSLRAQTAWGTVHAADLEIARGGTPERGHAFWGRFDGAHEALRYRLNLMHAEPHFAGYYRDQQFAHLGLDYSVTERWGLSSSVKFHRDNIARDPGRKAPDDRQLALGTDYQLSADTRFGFEYRLRARRDRHPVPEFDLRSQSMRLSVAQKFRTLNIYAIGDWGETRDAVSGERFDTALYLASALWQPSPRQSYGAYFFYDDNAFSTERQKVQQTIGINAHVRVASAGALDLNLQRNPDSGGHRRFTLNASLSHVQPSGKRLALTVRRATGAAAQTDVMVTYTVPFDLPVSRNRNVTTLSGRVHDAETGAGLPNVVLNLGGQIAVSDQTGLFTFPSVKVGTHYLSIDRSTEPGKIPVTPLPAAIEVLAEGANRIDIALVRGAALEGQVLAHEALDAVLLPREQGSDEGEIALIDKPAQGQELQTRGLQDVLVILRSGDRTYKRLTDRDGRFRIGGLPPGQWTVSIAGEGLPADLELKQGQIVLDLEPGVNADIAFKLMPKARRIRLLNPLEAIQT